MLTTGGFSFCSSCPPWYSSVSSTLQTVLKTTRTNMETTILVLGCGDSVLTRRQKCLGAWDTCTATACVSKSMDIFLVICKIFVFIVFKIFYKLIAGGYWQLLIALIWNFCSNYISSSGIFTRFLYYWFFVRPFVAWPANFLSKW